MTLAVRASKISTKLKFTRKQVAVHNTEESCWVIHNDNVYDVTEFMEDHPGGKEYILEYAGKSVTERMQEDHSASAFALLEDYLVGSLYTLKEEEQQAIDVDASRQDSAVLLSSSPSATSSPSPTDCEPIEHIEVSSARHRSQKSIRDSEFEMAESQTSVLLANKDPNFVDLKKPLLKQIWQKNYSKAYYMEQVHIPRHTPGSAPIFGGALELLTLTPWYVIPLLWGPLVLFCMASALQHGMSAVQLSLCFTLGLFVWTFIEYGLHRFLFHIDRWLPDNRVAITLHFLLHGIHHLLPMDGMRLVLPPALFVALATPFWLGFHALCGPMLARALLSGGFGGYVIYDCCHYYLHHGKVWTDYIADLKRYHMDHHYKDFDLGYGITSKLWDHVFDTVLV